MSNTKHSQYWHFCQAEAELGICEPYTLNKDPLGDRQASRTAGEVSTPHLLSARAAVPVSEFFCCNYLAQSHESKSCPRVPNTACRIPAALCSVARIEAFPLRSEWVTPTFSLPRFKGSGRGLASSTRTSRSAGRFWRPSCSRAIRICTNRSGSRANMGMTTAMRGFDLAPPPLQVVRDVR